MVPVEVRSGLVVRAQLAQEWITPVDLSRKHVSFRTFLFFFLRLYHYPNVL